MQREMNLDTTPLFLKYPLLLPKSFLLEVRTAKNRMLPENRGTSILLSATQKIIEKKLQNNKNLYE